MGMVYRAVDPTGKEVAVKVLAPSIGGIEGFRDRFEAEIQSLERLRHPHIVQMYGYGEQDGHLFYAMELVPGDTLQAQINRGTKFTWQQTVQIGIEIASALKHAHDHGIVHRDIKPANLLVDDQGRIKLTDFGIAKLFGSTNLTMGGGVIGTADFMSPEQAEGESATPRSDLYSLGGVLFALLAGRPPFRGRSIPEVIHKVRFDAPSPIGRLVENVPHELETIIDKLLAKDPQDRIPTPIALMKRLQAVLENPPVEPSPGKLPRELATGFLDAEKGVTQLADAVVSQTETVLIPADAGDSFAGNRASSTLSSPESRGRFIKVEPTVKQPDETANHLARNALAIGALVIGIGVLLGGAWLIFRPATADQMYANFVASSEAAEDGLPASQDDLESFIARFPADPRMAEVAAWLRSKELVRLERQFQLRMRQHSPAHPPTVIEELIGKALAKETMYPDDAVQDYKMIQGLYAVPTDRDRLSRVEKNCLDLVREKIRQLEEREKGRHKAHREVLQERLRIAETASPEHRTQILESIRYLYRDQPWAQDLIPQAQELLQTPRESSDVKNGLTDNSKTVP
jgi:eukaryotic-like serine/threonine-protein kinase